MVRRWFIALLLPVLVAAPARGAEELFQPVSMRDIEQHGSRFYLAGIMGASFATLTATEVPLAVPSATGPLFTSGGAAGIAFEMFDVGWRIEVEGRARDPLGETRTLADGISTSTIGASGGWSTTVNLWRDYDLTDRLGAYVGGGIGGGGYRLAATQDYPVQNVTVAGLGTVGGFAWQAGGGLAYDLTERITLDLGYRFFALSSGSVSAEAVQSGIPLGTQTFSSGFSASELFFAFRIHDPFRGRR